MGIREEPRKVLDALDVLNQVVFKLGMFTGLINQTPPDKELTFGKAATEGLYFFLDGLGEEIEEASEVIWQAIKKRRQS